VGIRKGRRGYYGNRLKREFKPEFLRSFTNRVFKTFFAIRTPITKIKSPVTGYHWARLFCFKGEGRTL
jgi:hypothetical protein